MEASGHTLPNGKTFGGWENILHINYRRRRESKRGLKPEAKEKLRGCQSQNGERQRRGSHVMISPNDSKGEFVTGVGLGIGKQARNGEVKLIFHPLGSAHQKGAKKALCGKG